jgi:hypothetical protein
MEIILYETKSTLQLPATEVTFTAGLAKSESDPTHAIGRRFPTQQSFSERVRCPQGLLGHSDLGNRTINLILVEAVFINVNPRAW